MKIDGAVSEQLESHERWVTDLILVRHGQTDWNVEGRMQGHEPVELNDKGRAQVEATGEMLAGTKPTAIVSSPVLRAVQSAEILAPHLGVSKDAIVLEPGFAEFEMGSWVGRTFLELWNEDGMQSYWNDPANTTFPDGESLRGIWARAVEGVNRSVAQHGGGPLVITTHGGIVRLIVLAAMGMPLDSYFRVSVANASVSVIRLAPTSAPKVHTLNAVPTFKMPRWGE